MTHDVITVYVFRADGAVARRAAGGSAGMSAQVVCIAAARRRLRPRPADAWTAAWCAALNLQMVAWRTAALWWV